MKPANDNHPLTADSFATLAERRAYIAATPDTRLRQAGAAPLATRLARARRKEDLKRLIAHAMPRMPDTWLLAANDNEPEENEDREEDDFGPLADCVFEIRPTEGELERLAKEMEEGKDVIKRNRRGHIVAWRGSDGKFRPVVEQWRHAKGARRKSEKEAAAEAARYLKVKAYGTLPGPVAMPSLYQSEGKTYWRMRHATMCGTMGVENSGARAEIDRLGLGASVPFARARANAGLPPAARLPVGVARGVTWLAQYTHSNPGATPSGAEGGHGAVEDATIVGIDGQRVDATLGEHAVILNESLFGLTAREIAARHGWGDGKAGERRAIKAQDTALVELAKVAA